jgi:hypothetical protein
MMPDLAAYLDQQLRAQGIPIVGVSVVVTSDRASWVVAFDPAATDAQKAQAQTVLNTIATDPPSITAATVDGDALAAMSTVAKALCALMLQVKLNRPLTTADIPQVQAMFADARKYYKFIVNNGL